MRVIALSVAIAGLTGASWLRADAASDVNDVFAAMAAALANANVSEFMRACDKEMTGYDTLKGQVSALVTDNEVSSSVETTKNEGDDAKRIVDLDWYLQIRSLHDNGPITVRRQIVHCEVRKDGKRWKVTSIAPADFFAPARLVK